MSKNRILSPKELGYVTISPDVEKMFADTKDDAILNTILDRHRKGDRGIVSDEERAMNTSSINDADGTVLSIYEMMGAAVIVRTTLSPFKNERGTDLRTGWEYK